MMQHQTRSARAGGTALGPLALAAAGVALCGAALSGAAAQDAGRDFGDGGRVLRVGNRCVLYGPGFVELDTGGCVRIIAGGIAGNMGATGHVRVDLGRGAGPGEARSWSAGGTANAALRSDGLGMLPGAADAQHLRVQGGTEYYGR